MYRPTLGARRRIRNGLALALPGTRRGFEGIIRAGPFSNHWRHHRHDHIWFREQQSQSPIFRIEPVIKGILLDPVVILRCGEMREIVVMQYKE